MKTVAKIDPEKEYENAKRIIELADQQKLENEQVGTLSRFFLASVDNLITATRVVHERENRLGGMASSKQKSETPKERSVKQEKRQKSYPLKNFSFHNISSR